MTHKGFPQSTQRTRHGSHQVLFESCSLQGVDGISVATLVEEQYGNLFVGSYCTTKRALKEAISAASTPKAGDNKRAIFTFGPPGNHTVHFALYLTKGEYSQFYNVSGYKLMKRYHEVGVRIVHTLFNAAKRLQPSVIFVDDIATIIGQKTNIDLSNAFLKCFKEVIDSDAKILLIGHSVRPYCISNPVLDLFSVRIFDDLPDDAQREDIMKAVFTYNPSNPGDSDKNYKYFASRTSRFTRDEIMIVCNKVCEAHFKRAVAIREQTGIHTQLVLTDEFIDEFLVNSKPTTHIDLLKMYDDFAHGVIYYT